MAVWQYSFDLVSKEKFNNIDLKILINSLKSLFWEIIEENNSRIVIWNYDSNNCIIYYNEWLIDSLNCRLDMRIITIDFINKLNFIVTKYKLNYLIIEEKIINWEEFLNKIFNSNAEKFVKNPQKYINEL